MVEHGEANKKHSVLNFPQLTAFCQWWGKVAGTGEGTRKREASFFFCETSVY
jgi:hypothetical protein